MLKRIGQLEEAPPWGIVTAITTIVAAFVMIIIGTTIVSVVFGNTSAVVMAGWIIGTLLMVIFVSITRNRDRESLRLHAGNTPVGLVILTGVAYALAIDLVSLAVTQTALPPVEMFSFFNPATIMSNTRQAAEGVTIIAWLLAFIFMAGAQPVGEQMVFSGVVFPVFRSAVGAWTGLFFTALAYALFHLVAYAPPAGGSTLLLWYAAGVPLLDGLFIGGVRAYTGSTRAAIAAHFAIGAVAALRALILMG